jgi:hypothetical protein
MMITVIACNPHWRTHHPRDVKAQHDRLRAPHSLTHVDNQGRRSGSARQPMPELVCRLTHSLALIRRTETAGRSSTHQRASYGLCSDHQSTSLLSVGTHIIVLIRLFAIEGLISKHWEEHGKIDSPFREGLHARAILLVLTLEVRKTRGRARTAGETYEPRDMARSSLGPLSDLTGVGGKTGSLAIIELSSLFRVSSAQILAAAFPENSGRPWNALCWASAAAGFGFRVRRYPDAAEHRSRSVTLLWLRGGW